MCVCVCVLVGGWVDPGCGGACVCACVHVCVRTRGLLSVVMYWCI